MLILGCLLVLVGSLLTTWSTLNLQRPPIMRAAAYRSGGGPLIAAEYVLGFVGAILIGLAINVTAGVVAAIAFWFSPIVLGPLLVAVGLWHEPPRL
jgi:hypothetical protein